MQAQQGWQAPDSSPYDGTRVFGFRLADGTLVDSAGNRLDGLQSQVVPTPEWMSSGMGSMGTISHTSDPAQMRYPMAPPPPSPLADGHAGPSNYAMYHQAHEQVNTVSPYGFEVDSSLGSMSAPRMTGHFPRAPTSEAPEAAASAPAPKPRTKSQPGSISTIRHYPNGHTGPSLRRGMACGFCRKRKLRCDAERPICANCIKYKQECEYVNQAMGQPRVSGQEEEKDHSDDTPIATASVPATESGILGRTASNSSLTETLVTPTTAPTFFNQSFPPRFGQEYLLQNLPAQPMGPPTVSTSPDGIGPPLYMTTGYNFPFTPYGTTCEPQEMLTPRLQSASVPAQTFPPPSLSPFTETGALSFPPWAAYHKSPTYPTPSSSLPSAPLSVPGPSISPSETFDVKPLIPASEPATPAYQPYNSSEYRTPGMDMPPRTRQSTLQSTDSLRSLRSTPDPAEPPPPSQMVDPNSPYTYTIPPPKHNVLYTSGGDLPELTIDPMDGLTARLGEFLFAPTEPPALPRMGGTQPQEAPSKRRKQSMSSERRETAEPPMGLAPPRTESDGLTNAARDQLLSIFLAHSRLFFEMSVPRFKYRMSFNDRRRPSLALLNSMYLWASRIAATPGKSPLEEAFFVAGCRTLEAQTSRADRLVDGMRAAMLLSAYAYTNGRYHEGFLLAGVATRLVHSTGIHQIASCTFTPPAPRNAILRHKAFLLPPPEDKLDLAERIHTFWAVYSIERCGALATGFPSALRDEDILTPFPRPMVDIASGNVTSNDDVTVRDLYRFSMLEVEDDSKLVKWLKALSIIERAAKLAFADPTDDSEYAKAMSAHAMSRPSAPSPSPPAWMDQPKYRCPGEYRVVKLALDQFLESMGVEGIFPVDRVRNAQIDGAVEPYISSHTMALHHILAAIYMFLHDINSIECENNEALSGARKSVALFRYLPQIPVADVDSFVVVIWGMVARTLLKEMHRLRLLGDTAAAAVVEEEADVIMREVSRVGVTMSTSRTQAMGLEAIKAMDSRSFASG